MSKFEDFKTGAHSILPSPSAKAFPLLIAAVVALVLAMVGSASAALSYFTPIYDANIATTEVNVSLSEQGEGQGRAQTISEDGTLLQWMGETPLALGKKYEERLSAVNSGSQDEYVRVVVHKYWKNADGNAVDLDPALIELTFSNSGWIVDETLSTPEQTVLYSVEPLASNASLPFLTNFRINPSLLDEFDPQTAGNVTTYSYVYDGYSFGIYVEVDSVQTHNALDAIRDIWGAGDNVTSQIHFSETE